MYFLLLNYENDNSCRSPSLWRRIDSGSRWFDYNLIRIDVGSFISCSYDNNNSITQRCFWLGRQLNWCVHRIWSKDFYWWLITRFEYYLYFARYKKYLPFAERILWQRSGIISEHLRCRVCGTPKIRNRCEAELPLHVEENAHRWFVLRKS